MRALLQRLAWGLLLCLLAPGLTWAQSGVISGQVLDAQTDDPLPGATVQVVETGVGTATGPDGMYRIGEVSPGEKTLRVSFVGYRTLEREVSLQAGEEIEENFRMAPSMEELNEVVVTGVTSETPKAKLSFSVEQVSSAQLQQAPASNALGSLQGKVAGASIVGASGQPGSGFSVRLRGTTSLTGDNSPLFIVDGVILGADQVDIGTLDIESIEVVKGAAASSLYGSRAQAGVINITTKRGGDAPLGQTRVTVRNEFGWQALEENLVDNRSHSLRTNQQGQLIDQNKNPVDFGEGAAQDESGPNGTSFRDNRYSDLVRKNGDSYETFDAFEQFFEPGNTWTNYVAVSQNTEATNFRLSFTNTREGGAVQGPVETKSFDRKQFRLNLDHRPADNVSIRASGFYSQSDNGDINQIDQEDPFFSLMFTSPLSDLTARDENGELFVQPDPFSQEINPLYMIENSDISVNRSRFLGSVRGEYTPYDWVTLQGNMSYDRLDRKDTEFYDRGFQTIDPSSINDGRTEKQNIIQEALNADITASLQKDFGDFTGRSQFKYQVENTEVSNDLTEVTNLATQGIPNLANGLDENQEGNKVASSFESTIRSESFYGSVEGDYKDRYIADVLVRRDGSSLFGADERWQTYFRAAGSYRISQEDFWPFESINEFKLRYSYGTAGARPNFEAQYETYDLSNGTFSKNTLGNDDLKPELSTEQEFGLEMGILDRVFVDVTYAQTDVEDQLLQVPLPGPVGFATQWQNAGSVESNTLEASVSADVIRKRDMNWSLGVTFDRTRQEITEFNTNAFRTGPEDLFFFRGDEDLGAMYGAKWVTETSQVQTMGFNPSAFDVNEDGYMVPVGEGNTFRDGFEKDLWGTSVDVDGDGQGDLAWGIPFKFQNEEGETFFQIGDTVPNYNVNVNTTFNWKGFSLYTLISTQVGGDVYNFTRQWSYRDGRNEDQDEFGEEQGLKKPNTYYETLYDATNKNNHFVEDATFVKVRELSLGYTFDRAKLNNLFGNANVLNRLEFSIIGRNLFTFTDYKGFDPEVGSNNPDSANDDSSLFRVDNFNYPPFRTITGRLTFQF